MKVNGLGALISGMYWLSRIIWPHTKFIIILFITAATKEKISMLKGKRHLRKTEFVFCEMCRFCCGVLIHLSLEKWDGMQSSGLSSMTTAVNPQVPQAPLWAWAPVQHHTWTAPSLPQLDTLQACVYGRREDRELKAHLSPFKPSKIHNFGVCLAKK